MDVKNRKGETVKLEVGARVRPVGPTKDNLTYGYVREIIAVPHDPRTHGREQAIVYWPETRGAGGGWTSIDLIAL